MGLSKLAKRQPVFGGGPGCRVEIHMEQRLAARTGTGTGIGTGIGIGSSDKSARNRPKPIPVRFQTIRNACIENVGKYQSCMVSKLPIIWKQTVVLSG